MITEAQFHLLRKRAMRFKYFSFGPLEYDDCIDADIVQNSEEVILLIDRSGKPNRIHWASDEPGNIIQHLADITDIRETFRIDFVPKEYVPVFRDAGFSIWAEWVDFFNNELTATEISFTNYDSIRFLKEEEILAVKVISASCAGYSRGFTGETEEWFREWMSENDVIVIEDGSEIVGYCCVSIYANGTILWVREIAIDPPHHREGFGRKLLEQAVCYGLKHGASRAFLHADIQNIGAIRLYSKYGFTAKNAEGEIQMVR